LHKEMQIVKNTTILFEPKQCCS